MSHQILEVTAGMIAVKSERENKQGFVFSIQIGKLTEEPSCIRAVTLTRRIVIGTRGGEICEIEKDGRIRIPIQGSSWGRTTLRNEMYLFSLSLRTCGRRNVGLKCPSIER